MAVIRGPKCRTGVKRVGLLTVFSKSFRLNLLFIWELPAQTAIDQSIFSGRNLSDFSRFYAATW